MAHSRAEIMTVREMIDAAIIFNEDEPIVDFKMLETILYILGRKLYVLDRNVIIKYNDMQKGQAKELLKSKRKVKVAQLKIHKASDKESKETMIQSTLGNSSSLTKMRTSSTFKSTDKSGKEKRKLKEGSSSEDLIYEKILVVSTMSDESQGDHSSPVVTQAQYNKILSKIRELQVKFVVIPNTDSKSSNLHKPTSLTEPKAALNMTSRLDAMYKEIAEMMRMITYLASGTPGIDLEGSYDKLKHILESLKDTNTQTTPSTVTDTSESETVVDGYTDNKDEVEEKIEEIDVENLATWSELYDNMDNILKNVVGSISKAANGATDIAQEAITLFTKCGPKLPEAKHLNPKLIKLGNFVNRFAKKVNAIDVEMVTQMSEFQEAASSIQMDVAAMLERIEEYLAHPLEDRAAVAVLNKEFSNMQSDLEAAHDNQTALSELQKQMGTDFARIHNLMEIICQNKTTKADAFEIMKNKLRMVDVNGMISMEQFCAVLEYLQREIRTSKDLIKSGETNWQIIIEDYLTYINEKCDHGAMVTLNRSLRDYCESMGDTVNAMLNITGDHRLNIYKKKMYRDDNCLSCGIPPVTKVSDKYINIARPMININIQDVKLDMTQNDDEITRKPCIPGQPIPHPLDPRALVCKRYCGASVSKTEGSPSLPGLEVVDVNLTNMTSMRNKTRLTCSPCNTSEFSFK